MLLDELLKFIPSDTEERVHRTRERFNQNIREILRQETGLRLRRSVREPAQPSLMGDFGSTVTADQITVRVELVPGLPQSLRQRFIEDKHRLAAFIAPWKDSLERLRDSAADVLSLAERLSLDVQGLAVVGNGLQEIPPIIELAERLLREASTFNLAEWILEVNEDVLGAYCYNLPDPYRPYQRRRQDPWIELYWAVIGLFARLLVVDIEDLTVVVLAHELAHAYTHLGADIDGHAWSLEEFAQTQPELKEGLAQHYAVAVCQRLALGAPKAKAAFDQLLRDQPPDYHTHEPWEEKAKPEELRLSLLQVRRSGVGSLADFVQHLDTAQKSLRH
jgi:hypothetical protein